MAACFFYNREASQVKADFLETARYLGYVKNAQPDEATAKLIEKCISQMHQILIPKLVYSIYDLHVDDNEICFAGEKIVSKNLSRNLFGCSKIVLFAATIGPKVDLMIRKAQFTDTVASGIYQSVGAMFIESFVDDFNQHIKQVMNEDGSVIKPRYSPGYGDVDLSCQKVFFKLLECNKIGLTLMDSLIMAPEKSVTAFIGIGEKHE